MQGIDSSWLSLAPAGVTLVLAFATRQVVPALFSGILTGSAVVLLGGGDLGAANPITRFLLPALGSKSFAQILLIYLWCLGGLIGLWERTGGARHFAERVGHRIARGPRSSMFFGWLVGLIFHQGGTVSTVLAATTIRPVTDRHRISHEELSYVVDSTASPVATLIPFNAWPAYVAALVAGTIPLLPDEGTGIRFFFSSLRFNFYALFAILSTLLLALGWLPWIGGTMARARRRARDQGALDAPGAEPMLPPPSPEAQAAPRPAHDYAPSLFDFGVPIAVLLSIAIVPTLLTGEGWINEAFVLSVVSGMAVAALRGLPLREIEAAFVRGCRDMTLGAIVLALAVTLGVVSKDLGTAGFVVHILGGHLPPAVLPALLMVLCMVIAFATGTSWGTYAVVFPVAMPLAWAVSPDPTFVQICFGAVLGGAVFGDQCSPISDTTILSSMFSGCDLMDHVRTQIPLALAAAGLGALCSTLAVLT